MIEMTWTVCLLIDSERKIIKSVSDLILIPVFSVKLYYTLHNLYARLENSGHAPSIT